MSNVVTCYSSEFIKFSYLNFLISIYCYFNNMVKKKYTTLIFVFFVAIYILSFHKKKAKTSETHSLFLIKTVEEPENSLSEGNSSDDLNFDVGGNEIDFNEPKENYESLCPIGNVITVDFGGGMGNNIWEYMSLYSAYHLNKKKCHLQPFVPMNIKNSVEQVFKTLSIPTLESLPESCLKGWETIEIGGHDDIPTDKLQGTNVILKLPQYSARYEFVAPFGFDNIRKELKFKEEYKGKAEKRLLRLKQKYFGNNDDVTFVGLHYRGTDYVNHIKKYIPGFKNPPDYKYYNKAMNYFQDKYQNVIFILITIDKHWLYQNKPYFPKDVNLEINPFERDKIMDMALLSHCNHSIISYGSFAATTALFAGGTTFVYDLGIPLNIKGPILSMGLASKLDNWKLLK